ncbi:hypothetical protein Tsubulata_005414 [Turnera subulata]|uniref:DUF4283 domain-containing protein n=1 Tax=Turnera subulata TaxID=218843 RepID=A0A9Q0G506_9ROSI|nr:hypothetical protein Tsubulata_005414 [Turnera subulata]
MAINELSGSLLDSNGAACDKSALMLDLSSLDRLLIFDSRVSKGKSVAAVTLNPRVSDLGMAPSASSSHEGSASQLVPNSDALASRVVPDSVPAPAPIATSWADMIKTGTSRQPLDFFPSVLENGTSVLKIPPNIVAVGRQKFSLCLVGQFLGPAPKLGFIHTIANKLWGRSGSVSVVSYRDGLFLFQFPTEASLSRALHGGPWHVNGISLILRPWDSKIQKLDISSSVLPVWVQLSDVPPELSTRKGVSYLASAIGKPLHMDQDCSKLLNSDRINVCVDVDFAKPLLPKLLVNLEDEIREVRVTYAWKPQHCDLCSQWGHHQFACPTKQRHATKWVHKAPAGKMPTAPDLPLPQATSIAAPAIPDLSINTHMPMTHVQSLPLVL